MIFPALLLLLISAGPAAADTTCKDIDPLFDSEGASCAAQELKQADAELNKVYKAVLAELDSGAETNPGTKEAKRQLIDAQRAWVSFRDSDCGAVYSYYQDGTVRVSAELSCELQRTRERTQQLQHLFDGT
jgi:uncharacterized protein YecT (DUF1311 family)